MAALTDGGTYEDPTTGGPLSGDALAANVAGVYDAFPDVRFEIVSLATVDRDGDRQRTVAHDRHQHRPASGWSRHRRLLDLPGADFFTYDAAADRLSSVVGYFDTATMLAQLGLQAHITPSDIEGVTEFGISLRTESGRDTIPGALTVTWIEVDPDHQMTLVDATTAIVLEQLANDDYLGTCFATIGARNYTFTAWTTPEAAQAALRGGAHSSAMKLAQTGGIGDTARGVTSMWTPHFLNGVFHAGTGSTPLAELEGQWL